MFVLGEWLALDLPLLSNLKMRKIWGKTFGLGKIAQGMRGIRALKPQVVRRLAAGTGGRNPAAARAEVGACTSRQDCFFNQ